MLSEEETRAESPECPCCGNPGESLGVLGILSWWRCRGCGVDYNTQTEEKSE